MPEEKVVNLGGTIEGFPKTPIVPDVPVGDPLPGKRSLNDMFNGILSSTKVSGAPNIPLSSFYTGGSRYTETRPFTDYEEMAAQQQSSLEKWRNATGKMVGVAATSFISGTAGLVYGIGSAIKNQRFASLIDNDITRSMDQLSTRLEDIAPNYYTKAEQDADWYSPDNIFTANFWSDKVLKNLGFSIGAIGGGMAWSSLFRGIGLTNSLVKAGKGLETLTAVEQGMANVPKLQKFAAFENALSSVAQKYVKQPLSAVLKDSDRILTSTMGTFGEASIEGLQRMNQFREKAIQDYIDKTGTRPTGEDLEEINRYADKIGMYTWGFNTLLLTGTNYISLPKILGSSRRAEKAMINDIAQSGIGTEFKAALPTTRFGKIIQGAKGLSKVAFAKSEAFEEGMQNAIQTGVGNYFTRAYENKEDVGSFLANMNGAMGNVLGEGVDVTLSTKEGLESILIGGLSGGLQQMRGTIKEQGVFGMGGQKAVNTDAALSALNQTNIKKVLQDGSDFLGIAIGSQKLRQQAIVNDDKLSEKDYESDFTLAYVMPRAKYGKVDSVMQELSYYESQAMDDAGLEQLRRNSIVKEKETREEFVERINNLKTLAKTVDQSYSMINDKYSGFVDDDGNRIYSDDVVDKLVYAAAKIKDYDKRIPGMNASLLDANIPTQDIISEVVGSDDIKVDAMNKALADIDAMDTDIDAKNDLKNNLLDLAEASLRRKAFIKEYNDIVESPFKYKAQTEEEAKQKAAQATSETQADGSEGITVKTKDGKDTVLSVGVDYIAGSKEVVTEEGVTLPKFLKFKVIGKTDTGNVSIQTPDGKVYNIKPSEFEKYNLGKYDDLSLNGKFFLENLDKKFNFRLKGGKNIEGYLAYDRDTKALFFESIEKRKNGKPLHRIPVTRDQFSPKEGYKYAQVWSNSKLTVKAEEMLQQPETEEEKDLRTNVEKNIEKRRAIVKEIYDRTKESVNNVDSKIVAKKEALAKVKEQIDELAEFRVKDKYSNVSIVTNFNKVLQRSLGGLRELTTLKQSLEREIEELEGQKAELEADISYFEDFMENLRELPEDYLDMMVDMEEQVNSLKDLVKSTGTQINQFSKLINDINDAIKDLANLLQSSLQKFDKDYPDYLRNSFEQMKDNPIYEKVQQLRDYVTDYALIQDVKKEISLNEDKIKEISDKIEGLYSQLTEVGREQRAKEQILSAFETELNKFLQQKQQEKELKDNAVLVEAVIGTMNQDVQNPQYDKAYEADPKKSDQVVVKSTTFATKRADGEALPEHFKRANRFGARLPNMKNKDAIQGAVVTANNEDAIIPGLTEFLAGGKVNVDPKTTIALVMVEKNDDGSLSLVNENGEKIAPRAEVESQEDYIKRLQNSGIFQVFPINVEKQFRETTSEETKKALTEEFNKWRGEMLANKETKLYNINASFGIPQKVSTKTEGDTETEVKQEFARVPVAESGLVSETDLGEKSVIYVPTQEEKISLGTTSFTNAIGRVFLRLKNGYVKLHNRRHNEKEATAIYDVMQRLSQIALRDKNVKSPEAVRLIEFLRSVVYWGSPKEGKDAGYNSVWFDRTEDGFKLFMSGKTDEEGKNVPISDFAPTALEDNKKNIIMLLQNMYSNTRKFYTDESHYTEKFEQILSISPEGEVVSKIWPNYQTYLLSSKDADGSARKSEDIPLTTNIRPLDGPEDINKDGIYFIIDDLDITERFLNVTPKAAAKEETVAAPTATTTTPAPASEFTLDGKTENKYSPKTGGTVTFIYNTETPDQFVEFGADKAAIEGVTNFFKAQGKDFSEDEVMNLLAQSLLKRFAQPVSAPKETPTAGQVMPTKEYVLDGKTDNIYEPATGGIVIFMYDQATPDVIKDFFPDDASIKGVINKIKTEKGVTIDENQARNLLGAKLLKELNERTKPTPIPVVEIVEPVAAPIPVAPTPTPVSDAQARKNKAIASIEKVADGWRTVADDPGGRSADELIADTKEELLKLIDDKYKDELPSVTTDAKPEVEPKIMLSGLNGGWKGVTKDSFDPRSSTTIQTDTPREVSFARVVKYEGKKYVVVGLRLQTARPADTVGRDNYSFAAAELNETTPKNIVKTLENAAKENFKNIYKDFNDRDVVKPITSKDAELDALESEVKPAVSKTVADIWNATPSKADDPELRVVLRDEIKKFEGENWAKVEQFLKKNFPNLPVYRVKNIIKGTNGVQAWGMLKNGALYIYENAEVGTAYHEIFEAVWKMFSDPKERAAIRKEFRSRKGEFVDRPTGRTIKYSEATDQEVKEQLAEEFRDYVQEGKIPQKPVDGRPFIVKLFSDIVTFIKNFFTGSEAKNNTERLFEKIGTGYYKTYIPQESALSYAKNGIIDIEDAFITDDAELSEIPGLTNSNVHDIMQQMTFLTIGFLQRDNKSLFNIPNLNKKDVYEQVTGNIQSKIKGMADEVNADIQAKKITQEEADLKLRNIYTLFENVVNNWDSLKETHELYLKKYGIEFDENDNVEINNENKTKSSEYDSANKIDNFRKMNSAVKLVLSTIPKLDVNGNRIMSSIGGVQLLPMSEVYISLMNNLSEGVTTDDMLEKLRQMALVDNNYKILYKRLTKSDATTKGVSWDNLNKYDAQLITAFVNTFDKQNPDVKLLNILSDGEVQVMESNLSTAARQVKNDFVNGLKQVLNNPKNPYFEYSDSKKAFIAKEGVVANIPLQELSDKVKFLESLGIVFNISDLQAMQRKDSQFLERFNNNVLGIRNSMLERKSISTIGGRMLDIDGRLLSLATVKAKIENPEFSSTYYGVGGEKLQTFMNNNPSSKLFKDLKQIERYEDLKDHPRYGYLYSDNFAQNSVILNAIFNINPATKTGNRRSRPEEFLKPGIADGTNNQPKGKKKESSSLNFRERLIQELNMNIDGFYYNLVAGDASMEYMTYMGNHVTSTQIAGGLTMVNQIFKGYFIDEVNLARENRPVAKDRNSTDLRFFSAILDAETLNKIKSNKNDSAEKIYNDNKAKIEKAIEKYIQDRTDRFKQGLFEYKIVTKNLDDTYSVDNLKMKDSDEMSKEALDLQLKTMTVNFMISNIEFHKLIYSDPFQYSDELKRVKNFLSPRQSIISGSSNMNSLFNRVYNEGFAEDDKIGRTDFTKDSFTSITLEDVEGIIDIENYGNWEETDGGGLITMQAYRNFRIRASNWNDAEESQYRHDVEYERLVKSGATEEQIEKFEKNNPGIKSAYTAIKPIVSGSKANGKPYNDVMLDKFALYPVSYRIMRTTNPSSNAVKFYDKMRAESIDYAVFRSGRKVGSEKSNKLYNEDGSFSTAPFEGIINVPFNIMGVQSEVPSKEEDVVTRGSQVTKLITMDFMEAGVPVDFQEGKDFATRMKNWEAITEESEKEKQSPLYKEIKRNQTLLEEMMEEGYTTLLKKLGMKDENGEIKISDFSKVADTLREEIFKRETNNNINLALKGFLNGDVVLEATPAYQQIKYILYSLLDKNVVSPKITGGLKVQIPSTLFESNRIKVEEINGKKGYTSDVLKFYEDKNGKRVAEIMVGRWFDSDMTDEQLLTYLNETEEGQKILQGLAFRIPTQKQNSIDAIKIAKFLPKEFGDSVVIPSALVKKVGSDFDIDKLSIYLKNVYTDPSGKIKLVPFLGYGEQAKEKLRTMFDNGEFLRPDQARELDRIIEEERDILADDSSAAKLMVSILKESLTVESITKDYIKSITKDEFKETFINRLYKQSLENEYVQSGQNLVSNPKNYKRLITPNSADQLKNLSKKIVNKRNPGQAFDYKSVGNMLDRIYMSSLRHAFVRGKYAIGIAAIAQTNHSMNQRQPIYIDFNKISQLSAQDRFWLTGGTMDVKDAAIKFEKYNSIPVNGKMVPTLSMITNAEKNKEYPNGQDISDINGQFIDGYVDIAKGPWIMEFGATPNTAGTWLFLNKLGVPIEDIAYFMNQPIIVDYLRMIENAGYSSVFIDTFVDIIKSDSKYATTGEMLEKVSKIPGATKLYETIGKDKLSAEEKAEQQFILNEFLKYSKMSDNLLMVTQGTNFDTASLNDPYLIFKKQKQLEKARKSIISSPDALLKNSFIGKLEKFAVKSRNAMAEILRSDKPAIRKVLENVLMPYVNMPDRAFLKISQKVVNDFFDWAVQVDTNRNKTIKDLLLSDDNVAKKVDAFKKEIANDSKHALYNNYIIGQKGILTTLVDKRGGVNNISIKNKDNKVYDQDQIIFSFKEIRDHLKTIGKLDLYKGIVGVSVLQSGLSTTPYSFTSLLPYEDFKEVYNETLSKLEKTTDFDINKFYELDVFQRNNWANDDIVPHEKARIAGYNFQGIPNYNMNMKFGKGVSEAINNGEIPRLVKLSTLSQSGSSDLIVYSWERIPEGKTKKQMIKDGDYSYIQKGLFKKVYMDDARTIPAIESYKDKKGAIRENFVYKMINAWGDSFRANEFYDVIRTSEIDNGFIKVQPGEYKSSFFFAGQEISETIKTSPERPDADIRQFFGGTPVKTVSSQPEVQTMSSVEVVSRYTDADVKANPNKIYVFGDNTQRVGTGGQAQIRNNPNAMGIATKLAPSMDESAFMTDKDLSKNKSVIDGDIAKIKATGKSVVLPKDGLGTGLAKLKEKAPQTYAYLKQRLLEEFGFNNDSGNINQPSTGVKSGAELALKAQVVALEDKKKTTGLSPAEMGTLLKLQTELGKLIKSQC